MSESADRCCSEHEQRHTECAGTECPAVPAPVPGAPDLRATATACSELPAQRRGRRRHSPESRDCAAAPAVPIPPPALVLPGRRRGILPATGAVARLSTWSSRRGARAGSACTRSAAAQAARSARRRARSKGMVVSRDVVRKKPARLAPVYRKYSLFPAQPANLDVHGWTAAREGLHAVPARRTRQVSVMAGSHRFEPRRNTTSPPAKSVTSCEPSSDTIRHGHGI